MIVHTCMYTCECYQIPMQKCQRTGLVKTFMNSSTQDSNLAAFIKSSYLISWPKSLAFAKKVNCIWIKQNPPAAGRIPLWRWGIKHTQGILLSWGKKTMLQRK